MGTKRYPEEFRREAVELWRSSDRPRCRVAESLGISDGTLVAWSHVHGQLLPLSKARRTLRRFDLGRGWASRRTARNPKG